MPETVLLGFYVDSRVSGSLVPVYFTDSRGGGGVIKALGKWRAFKLKNDYISLLWSDSGNKGCVGT